MKFFKYRILNHVFFWVFIYVFYTTPFVLSYGFSADAFINLIYLPFDILTVYAVIGFLIPRLLFKDRKILLFVLGTAGVISINIFISQIIKYDIQPRLGFWVVKRPFVVDMFYSLLTNFMIVGTASALIFLRYSFTIQLKQSELIRRSIQSELGILRSQVNPHFLFNVLNNIDALIFEDKEKASNAIFLLSKIMRYMLKESSTEKAKLNKEIEYIQDYLELAKLSFENENYLDFKVNGNVNGKEIPPLLFIPIIENAIKHCNKQSAVPGIYIEFLIADEFIELKTSNYIKRNDFKLPDSGTGTGLKNVEKRLKLIFAENYTFEVNKKADKFEVYLKVPTL